MLADTGDAYGRTDTKTKSIYSFIAWVIKPKSIQLLIQKCLLGHQKSNIKSVFIAVISSLTYQIYELYLKMSVATLQDNNASVHYYIWCENGFKSIFSTKPYHVCKPRW